jgi:hypothetical protein
MPSRCYALQLTRRPPTAAQHRSSVLCGLAGAWFGIAAHGKNLRLTGSPQRWPGCGWESGPVAPRGGWPGWAMPLPPAAWPGRRLCWSCNAALYACSQAGSGGAVAATAPMTPRSPRAQSYYAAGRRRTRPARSAIARGRRATGGGTTQSATPRATRCALHPQSPGHRAAGPPPTRAPGRSPLRPGRQWLQGSGRPDRPCAGSPTRRRSG